MQQVRNPPTGSHLEKQVGNQGEERGNEVLPTSLNSRPAAENVASDLLWGSHSQGTLVKLSWVHKIEVPHKACIDPAWTLIAAQIETS